MTISVGLPAPWPALVSILQNTAPDQELTQSQSQPLGGAVACVLYMSAVLMEEHRPQDKKSCGMETRSLVEWRTPDVCSFDGLLENASHLLPEAQLKVIGQSVLSSLRCSPACSCAGSDKHKPSQADSSIGWTAQATLPCLATGSNHGCLPGDEGVALGAVWRACQRMLQRGQQLVRVQWHHPVIVVSCTRIQT